MKILLLACVLSILLVGCAGITPTLSPPSIIDSPSPTPLATSALSPTTLAIPAETPTNSLSIIPRATVTATPSNPSSPTSRPIATQTPGAASVSDVGYLEGHVTIGPLRPVEQIDEPTPIVPPEVYAARSINIFRSDGTTLVINVKINSDGNYRVALAPGVYVVALARTGIDRAGGLPKQLTIESGKTMRLDISIDTGIR